jgi:hypothetical protein
MNILLKLKKYERETSYLNLRDKKNKLKILKWMLDLFILINSKSENGNLAVNFSTKDTNACYRSI